MIRRLVVVLALLLAGCAADGSGSSVSEQPTPGSQRSVAALQGTEPSAPEPTATATTSPSSDDIPAPHRTQPPTAERESEPELFTPDVPQGVTPVSVTIPTIGVDEAPTIDLGLQDDGSMEVPSDFSDTGWFTGSPRPGAPGAAVLAGHVDSTSGPAVFFRLHELAQGDEVVVQGADGKSSTFQVDSIEQYPKDDFPAERVYGYVREPQLRLITCGGEFDRGEGSYRDNIVVYASVVDTA
jgi:sortase (surface protein transpeptidase)